MASSRSVGSSAWGSPSLDMGRVMGGMMDLPYKSGSDVAVLDGEGIGGYGVRVI